MEKNVENILSKRKEIISLINDLTTIQKISSVINGDNFSG